MSQDYREISALVLEISEYFENHPNAADSLQGICRWWLQRSEHGRSEESVLKALEYLCEKGLVIKTIGPSGSAVYSSAKKLN